MEEIAMATPSSPSSSFSAASSSSSLPSPPPKTPVKPGFLAYHRRFRKLSRILDDDDSITLSQMLLAGKNKDIKRQHSKDSSTADSKEAAATAAAKRKRPPRSSEMVRNSCSELEELAWRIKIRATRITYDSLRLLLSVDRKRCRRPDLKAQEMMMDRNLCLHRDRRFLGHVPGTVIGDVFFFRAEIFLVGLHGTIQAGIDFVPGSKCHLGEPIATSIMVSGGYADNDDRGDVIVYTGQGGKNRNNTKHKEDQRLRAGNLGLLRSKEYGIEIRVIRGFNCEGSPSGKIYVYDGLYKVTDSWQEKGLSGFSVYKFKLLRVTDQEALGSDVIMEAERMKAEHGTKWRPGCLSLDLSMKTETLAIPVFNDLNDNDTMPLSFEYLKNPKYPPQVFERNGWTGQTWGCQCEDGCSNDCWCVGMNGGEFPYDENGILLKGKPRVFECGPFCKCPDDCINRVSQKGMTSRLEMFKSLAFGWGVRNLEIIRAGAFVCEISGIVVPEGLAQAHDACLVHPAELQPRWLEWGDVSDIFPNKAPDVHQLPKLGFSLDLSKLRNVGCYLSHNSWPNLFVQHVLYDHYNEFYPHLMVFAMENIPPLTALSIDYGIRD